MECTRLLRDHNRKNQSEKKLSIGPLICAGGSAVIYVGIYEVNIGVPQLVAVKLFRSGVSHGNDNAASNDDITCKQSSWDSPCEEQLCEFSLQKFDEFCREAEILRKIQHQNVVQYYAALIVKDGHMDLGDYLQSSSLSTRTCSNPRMAILLELAHGGDVASYVKNHVGPLSVPEVLKIGIDTARGMQFLHEIGIVHRDLKPANLLLSSEGVVKVSDFGLATIYAPQDQELTGEVGTYRYMAPELLMNEPYDGSVDVYSFGMTLSEVVTGRVPFSKLQPMQAALAVARKTRPRLDPSSCSSEILHLIEQCWDHKPQLRPTFAAIVTTLETLATGHPMRDLKLQAEDIILLAPRAYSMGSNPFPPTDNMICDSWNIGRDSGNIGRDSGNIGCDSENIGKLPESRRFSDEGSSLSRDPSKNKPDLQRPHRFSEEGSSLSRAPSKNKPDLQRPHRFSEAGSSLSRAPSKDKQDLQQPRRVSVEGGSLSRAPSKDKQDLQRPRRVTVAGNLSRGSSKDRHDQCSLNHGQGSLNHAQKLPSSKNLEQESILSRAPSKDHCELQTLPSLTNSAGFGDSTPPTPYSASIRPRSKDVIRIRTSSDFTAKRLNSLPNVGIHSKTCEYTAKACEFTVDTSQLIAAGNGNTPQLPDIPTLCRWPLGTNFSTCSCEFTADGGEVVADVVTIGTPCSEGARGIDLSQLPNAVISTLDHPLGSPSLCLPQLPTAVISTVDRPFRSPSDSECEDSAGFLNHDKCSPNHDKCSLNHDQCSLNHDQCEDSAGLLAAAPASRSPRGDLDSSHEFDVWSPVPESTHSNWKNTSGSAKECEEDHCIKKTTNWLDGKIDWRISEVLLRVDIWDRRIRSQRDSDAQDPPIWHPSSGLLSELDHSSEAPSIVDALMSFVRSITIESDDFQHPLKIPVKVGLDTAAASSYGSSSLPWPPDMQSGSLRTRWSWHEGLKTAPQVQDRPICPQTDPPTGGFSRSRSAASWASMLPPHTQSSTSSLAAASRMRLRSASAQHDGKHKQQAGKNSVRASQATITEMFEQQQSGRTRSVKSRELFTFRASRASRATRSSRAENPSTGAARTSRSSTKGPPSCHIDRQDSLPITLTGIRLHRQSSSSFTRSMKLTELNLEMGGDLGRADSVDSVRMDELIAMFGKEGVDEAQLRWTSRSEGRTRSQDGQWIIEDDDGRRQKRWTKKKRSAWQRFVGKFFCMRGSSDDDS